MGSHQNKSKVGLMGGERLFLFLEQNKTMLVPGTHLSGFHQILPCFGFSPNYVASSMSCKFVMHVSYKLNNMVIYER